MQNYEIKTGDGKIQKLFHDIRGPIAVIQGFFDELDKNVTLSPNQKALFELAERSVGKILEICTINEL